jgi:hypothetical protein
MECRIEIQSCDLKTFLDDQNSDNFWVKNGEWEILNVETLNPTSYNERTIVWLMRTVEVSPSTYTVVKK